MKTWLDENKRYFEYINYKLNESKENIIRKLNNLTDEQKQIAIDFFNRHNAWEREIDWNKGQRLTWDEDFVPVIYKDRDTASQRYKKNKAEIKKAIEGLTEGEDYLVLGTGIYKDYPWTAYQPLTYLGSKVLASNSVPPVRTDLNRNGNEFTGAQWCVSWQITDNYWRKHSGFGREAFIFLFGETVPTKKVAISICATPDKDSDADGSSFEFEETFSDGIHYFNIWNYENRRNIYFEKISEIMNLKKYMEEALSHYDDVDVSTAVDEERERAIEDFGDDAVEAYDQLYGFQSYRDMKDRYIGYFENEDDMIMDIFSDFELTKNDIINFLDLERIGENIIDDDLSNLSNEEFMEFYSYYGAKLVDKDGNEISYDDEDIDYDDYEIDTSDINYSDVGREFVGNNLFKHFTLRDLNNSSYSWAMDWKYIENFFENDYDSYNDFYFFNN